MALSLIGGLNVGVKPPHWNSQVPGGGSGNDWINRPGGGSGNDRITRPGGGSGNDTIPKDVFTPNGGSGNDRITWPEGGSGSDTISSGQSGGADFRMQRMSRYALKPGCP